jgi:hypothetical protein
MAVRHPVPPLSVLAIYLSSRWYAQLNLPGEGHAAGCALVRVHATWRQGMSCMALSPTRGELHARHHHEGMPFISVGCDGPTSAGGINTNVSSLLLPLTDLDGRLHLPEAAESGKVRIRTKSPPAS